WSGAIDDLRIYRRALAAAEVVQLAQVAPAPLVEKVAKPAGDAKVSQAIDQILVARQQRNNIKHAPAADDAEFFRPVMLDLTGRIPTLEETEAFLADRAEGKRGLLIEKLLAGREMPMAWAPILSGWLMPRANRRDPFFVGYLRAGLAKNKPWDRFAREMLVA